MYVCVLDFEATCWDNNEHLRSEMEIIEFPSILLKINDDNTYKEISTFHEYVKPNIHPVLSDFCKNLTKIKQETIDSADTFDKVYNRHHQWVCDNVKNINDLYFVTCGQWDLHIQLISDCIKWNLRIHDIYKKHLDIKRPFQNIHPNCKMGMIGMLEKINIQHTGIHHSGIDDTKNITKIFIHILKNYPEYIEKNIQTLEKTKRIKYLETQNKNYV